MAAWVVVGGRQRVPLILLGLRRLPPLALLGGRGSSASLPPCGFAPRGLVRRRLAAGASPPRPAVIAVLAGPTAYTVDTVTTAHTGSIPTAGPP